MREYGKVYASFWQDENGRVYRVPRAGKLHFRYRSHAALRAFVFRRDGFKCMDCAASAVDPPAEYSGRATLDTNREYAPGPSGWPRGPVPLMVDHVVSSRNGGSNHPSNLATRCGVCNSAKAGLVDAKYSREAA